MLEINKLVKRNLLWIYNDYCHAVDKDNSVTINHGNTLNKFIIVNCCCKAPVNLNRYSETVIYTNIFGYTGESNDSFFKDILLENIDKEIPTNFSLFTTPVKDTTSISKTSAISKLENNINEIYDDTAKIQLKQAILREVKQQFPNETIEKVHRDELLCSLHS